MTPAQQHSTPRERALARLAFALNALALLHALMAAGIALVPLALPEAGAWLMPATWDAQTTPLSLPILLTSALLWGLAGAWAFLGLGVVAQEGWVWAFALALGAGSAVLGALGFGVAWLSVGGAIFALVNLWRLRGAFRMNPVTLKELRGRMRGVRAFAVIGVFLAMMGAFTVLLYLLSLSRLSGTAVVETGQLGRDLFRGVMALELALVILIVPSLTVSAVSGEREQQTYDLLATTLLPAPAFLMGKLSSALGYVGLLVLSAVPLQSVAFLFGGISALEVLLGVVGLMATAFILATLGLWMSATQERTLNATVRVYTLTLGWLFGVPLLMGLVNALLGKPIFTTLTQAGAYGNALAGVGTLELTPMQESLAIYADLLYSGLNPLLTAHYTQEAITAHEQAVTVSIRLASNGETLAVLVPYLVLGIAALGVGALTLWRATRKL
jgi:hypothetical protein